MRTLEYPPLACLESAGVDVRLSAPALRLMWRIHLSAPEYEPGPKPQAIKTPTKLTAECRVWESEPGAEAKDIEGWTPEDFDAMTPFNDDDPFANLKPLTEPPCGRFQLRISNLERYRDNWPKYHPDCYDHKAWPRPEFCSHGVPAPAKPPVLYLSAEPGRPFITIGDYVRHVRKWVEMGIVARDLHRAWSDMGQMASETLDADCSPCDGGVDKLHFTTKGRTKAQWKRLAKEYNSSLHRKDDAKAQYQLRGDRRTAELMKRSPCHLLAIKKAIVRREEGLEYDSDDSEDVSDSWQSEYGGSDISASGPSQKLPARSQPPHPPRRGGRPTGRYPSLSDLRLALCVVPRKPKTADVIFSLAANQLRWTVQLKREPPGAGRTATLNSVIQVRRCVKPQDLFPWDPSSATAAQPLTQPPVGSLTIDVPELVNRDVLWVQAHRKCFGDADEPELVCPCGEKRYIAPVLKVEAANGHDFVTVGDYVQSVRKWMEGEDVAEALAEEWFAPGIRGCKRARV